MNLSLGIGIGAGGFAPQFSLLSLPGLVWWLDASDVVLAGSKVSQMNDRSGSGDPNRNASQSTDAARPTYNAADAAYNGQPTISGFAATGVRLATPAWNTTYPTPLTLFHVGEATASLNQYFYSRTNQTPRLDANAFSNQGRLIGSASYTQGGIPVFTKHVMCAVWNGAASKVFVNSRTAAGTGDTGTSDIGGGTGMTVGTWTTGGTVFGVNKLALIAAISRVATDAEIALVMNALGARFAIPIAP